MTQLRLLQRKGQPRTCRTFNEPHLKTSPILCVIHKRLASFARPENRRVVVRYRSACSLVKNHRKYPKCVGTDAYLPPSLRDTIDTSRNLMALDRWGTVSPQATSKAKTLPAWESFCVGVREWRGQDWKSVRKREFRTKPRGGRFGKPSPACRRQGFPRRGSGVCVRGGEQ